MVRGGADQAKFVYLDMPDFGLDVLLVQPTSNNAHVLSNSSNIWLKMNFLVLEAVQHKESGELVQTI